MISTACE